MNPTLLNTLTSLGWEYLGSMPLSAENDDHIGDIHCFKKDNQTMDITHYFYSEDES